MINVGDIYWIKIPDEITHPHVAIAVNGQSLIMCAITTNMKKLHLPGNVLLESGEAGLEKQSIVNVAKVLTIGIEQLGEYIGSTSEQRITEILAGINFLQKSFFNNRHQL
jgi:mRNA interferase MazF